jgi:hypothetical protein
MGMRLVHELGAGSGEKEKGERGAGKKRRGSRDCRKNSKNRLISPKIEIFSNVNFNNSNFSKKWDLLLWVQKSLLPS